MIFKNEISSRSFDLESRLRSFKTNGNYDNLRLKNVYGGIPIKAKKFTYPKSLECLFSYGKILPSPFTILLHKFLRRVSDVTFGSDGGNSPVNASKFIQCWFFFSWKISTVQGPFDDDDSIDASETNENYHFDDLIQIVV